MKKKLDLKNIKAVIFDMDGTMIDNNSFHRKAWIEFCRRRGINLTEADYKKKISGKRNDDIFEILFGKRFAGKKYEELDEEKEAMYREIYKPFLKETKGLSKLINKIKKQGLQVAIATTSPKANRVFILQALNMLDLFDAIVGGEHSKKGKPDPEIYLLTAEQLGVKPSECIAFEDTPAGIKSAKTAGMAVGGVLTTHTKDELKDADFLVKDFTEVNV